MCMEENFVSLLESSFKKYWDQDALTDYKGTTLQYKDLARKIEKLHLLFAEGGVVPGDKIAICGRNSSHWAVVFLASLTYGVVAVPILHEFTRDSIHYLVNHSEARILFVGSMVREEIDAESMPQLEGLFEMEDFDPIVVRNAAMGRARERLNELYGRKYPARFTCDDVNYRASRPEDLAIINYTSGTTSRPKGVMLPYRVLQSNVNFAMNALALEPGSKLVSMLPMAHTYGLSFEFLYEIVAGVHIHFLTRTPSPRIIFEAFAEIRPNLIVTVPLIIEKIIKKNILPRLQAPAVKVMLHLPVVSDRIRATIREQILESFGGNVKMIVIGGAAFNGKVEEFLHRIDFPYTVGYGMTECGPIICFESPANFAMGSCGKVAPRMTVRIDNPDPVTGIGEVICRGENVMMGYYRNEEATRMAIDADGWLHTGDLGLLDEEGNLFLKGRSKNMLLGSSGQNIYPEEIEDKLSAYPLVSECLIVQREGHLVALVCPDYEEIAAHDITPSALTEQMEDNCRQLNQQLASYEQITKIEIQETEFEKTPKRSIKRFIYS